MSGPPLSVQAQRRSLVQVARSFATGSPLLQALTQRCQRLSYELRLCEPVHPVVVSTAACGGRLGGGPAHDGVLYLPRPRPRTDRGDAITPYHVTPTYSTRKRRAPSGVALRAHLPEPDSVEASGAHFPIKTGAQFPIGITIATKQKIPNQLSRGTSSHDVKGGINRVFRAVEDGEAEAGQTWLLGKSRPP